MFNLLVESTAKSRRRTPGYFLVTFLVYGLIMATAVIGSILVYRPALADTYESFAMVAPPPPSAPSGGSSSPHHSSNKPTQVISSTAIPSNESNHNAPAIVPNIDFSSNVGTGIGSSIGNGNGSGNGGGIVPGGIPDLGPAPKLPVVTPPAVATNTNEQKEDKIFKPSEGVILGKAIHIPVPNYPPLAKQVRLEGIVKVEMMLDKTGHVISARAVSGPQLLCPSAEQAAKAATFRPTLLSGEPVMVQAVITFVFKINN